MTENSYEALRKIQVQERNFGALSNLEDDFYERYNLWIAEQKRLLHTDFSIQTLKAYENAKKIIEEISAKREQKIVLKALKDLRNDSVDSSGMSKEEKALYLRILSSVKEFETTVVQFAEKKETLKKPEKPNKTHEKLLTIKFLVSMGKFVAPDGTTYGPYEPEQIVSMEKEIAEILLKKGAAEKTDALEGIERIESRGNGNNGNPPNQEKGSVPDTVEIH